MRWIGRIPLTTGSVFGCLTLALAVITGYSSPNTAQFSLTGQLNVSWTGNRGCAVSASGGIEPSGADVTVSLVNGSPIDLAVEVPRNGGSFSLPHSPALVVVQVLANNQGWTAESPSLMGSGTVTVTANGRSGSMDVTLKPVDLNVPGVRPASHDVHVAGSWSGCPAPIPGS